MSPINAAASLATTDTSEEAERPALRLVSAGDSSPSHEGEYDVEGGGALAFRSWKEPGAQSDDETYSATRSCVEFVDDWSGISAKDALLASYGVPVAVPVGLCFDAAVAAVDETGDAAVVDIAVGAVLQHLRFVEPSRALAVHLRFGLGGEPEHTVRQISQRIGVSPTTASRYVREGLGELRLRIALADV